MEGAVALQRREARRRFFVNDQKGFYHDFSSGKHGDIFAFVMETEGLPFPEAVERLAGIAGVTLPKISRGSRAAGAAGASRWST